MTLHDTYLSNRDFIEWALTEICRRHRLLSPDSEDFCQDFRVHLIEGEYAPILAFRGQSSLKTYLLTVATNFFRDWRNSKWGKWRPSAEAKRLGPLAEQLETLLVRDRHTLDEAFELIRTRHGMTASRSELEALAARLPQRVSRTHVSADVEEVSTLPAKGTQADGPLFEQEAERIGRRYVHLLAEALGALPIEDQLLLRMHFVDRMSVVDIARMQAADQKALYRKRTRVLVGLRTCLEAAGLTREEVRAVMERGGFDFTLVEAALRETLAEVRLAPIGGRPLDAKRGLE